MERLSACVCAPKRTKRAGQLICQHSAHTGTFGRSRKLAKYLIFLGERGGTRTIDPMIKSHERTGPQRLRWHQNAKNSTRANVLPNLPNSGHVVSARVIPNPVWQVQQHDVTVRSSEGYVNKKGSGYFAK